MSPEEKIRKSLSSPSRLLSFGSRDQPARKLNKKLAGFVRTGILSSLMLAQAVSFAAGVTNPHLEQVSSHSVTAVDSVAESKSYQNFNSKLDFTNEVVGDSSYGLEAAEITVQAQISEVVFNNPISEIDFHEGVVLDSGHINGIELINKWNEVGVELNDILSLTETLILTQSPTISLNEDAAGVAKDLAERTSGIYEISSAEEAKEFLSKNSLVSLEKEGLISSGFASAISRTAVDPDFEFALNLWEGFSKHTKSSQPTEIWASGEESKQSLDGAIESLKIAVQESGIKTLTIPLPMWTSSERLAELADDIRSANMDMQEVTGWEGQVLGLKGNLSFVAASPYDIGILGVTKDGSQTLLSKFDYTGHEFVHGLDSMLARDLGVVSGDKNVLLTDVLMENKLVSHYHNGMPEDLNAHHHHGEEMSSAWKHIAESVENNSGAWSDRLSAEAESYQEGEGNYLFSKEYFQSSREAIAYSFSAYLNENLGENSVLFHHDAPKEVPTYEENKGNQEAWKKTFSELSGWYQSLGSKEVYLDNDGASLNRSHDDVGGAVSEPIKIEFASFDSFKERVASRVDSGPSEVASSDIQFASFESFKSKFERPQEQELEVRWSSPRIR